MTWLSARRQKSFTANVSGSNPPNPSEKNLPFTPTEEPFAVSSAKTSFIKRSGGRAPFRPLIFRAVDETTARPLPQRESSGEGTNVPGGLAEIHGLPLAGTRPSSGPLANRRTLCAAGRVPEERWPTPKRRWKPACTIPRPTMIFGMISRRLGHPGRRQGGARMGGPFHGVPIFGLHAAGRNLHRRTEFRPGGEILEAGRGLQPLQHRGLQPFDHRPREKWVRLKKRQEDHQAGARHRSAGPPGPI